MSTVVPPTAPRTPLTDTEAGRSESEEERIIITPELWMDRDSSRHSETERSDAPLDLKTSLPPPSNPPVQPIEVKPRSIREELRMVGSIKKEATSSAGSRRGTTNHRPPRMTDREKIRQIRLRDQISVSLANPISVRTNTPSALLTTPRSSAGSDTSRSPPPALSASAAAAVAASQANLFCQTSQQSLLYHHLLPSSLLTNGLNPEPRSNITEQRRRASRETSATPTPRASNPLISPQQQATSAPPPPPPTALPLPAALPPAYMAAALGAGLFPPTLPPPIPGLFPPPPAGLLPPSTLMVPCPIPIPIPLPIPIPIPIPMRKGEKGEQKDEKNTKTSATPSEDKTESESVHSNCACCSHDQEEDTNVPHVINIRPNSESSVDMAAAAAAAYRNHLLLDTAAARVSSGSDVENEAMDLSTGGGGSIGGHSERSRTLSPHLLGTVDQNKNHTTGSKSVSPGVSSTTSDTEREVSAAAATSYMLSSMMQDASSSARYQSRRSLILDAPTIPKQKHRSPSPSSRDYYSKRRCIRARLKTK